MGELKVAIVGGSSGWRGVLALDSSWEVWSCNQLYRLGAGALASRATRWWEIHGYTPLTKARRPIDHWQKLEDLQIPIYTLFDLPGITNVRVVPVEAFATAYQDYFACTFAYQIAQALFEGVTDLRLYGVALIGDREALVEAKCVDWWLGYAEGRGVRVGNYHDSEYGLGKQPYRYAYNDQAERYLAYRFAYAHHLQTEKWMHYEEMRLRVRRPFWEPWLRWCLARGYGRSRVET